MSLVTKKGILLENLVPEPIYFLNRITTRFKYNADNQRTEDVLGFNHVVTNTEVFEQLNVFVETKKPIITPEKLSELQDSGTKVFVELENAIVKVYYSERTRSIEDSVKADSIKILDI